MRLGLLTDIHEDVERLRMTLKTLEQERVDRIVVLGDVFETGERLEETCQCLIEANSIGVWGNHDFGLCSDPSDEVREKYGKTVIAYMTSLLPHLEISDCYFAHVEPWLNPNDILDLWFFEGLPVDQSRRQQIFSARTNRVMFAGHYHRWLHAVPNKTTQWRGETLLSLNEGRHFVAIGALVEGCYAIFDTATFELTPLTC